MREGGEWKKGLCGVCPAGCWIEARIEDGKLHELRADSSHPLGMICRRGQHAAEIIYSENRLKYPMRRTGAKGRHAFERISWDQAYEIIVENLNRIKTKSGPEAVSIYTGRGAFELSLCDMYQPKGVAVSSASNILFPFGSPNTMGVGALCYVSFAMMAPDVTLGTMLTDMYTDMENAELLLVWGANPATDSPPLDMHRLEAAAKRGCEIVVIDPRYTETARRTEAEWIPIRPGTDGALALSMTGVLIDEDCYDHKFIDQWGFGFDELAGYVQHFSPPVAEKITGVPAKKIHQLARRIASAAGAAPVMYTGLEYSNSGIQAVRAVLSLFAIGGHLDMPGGIGLAMRNQHFPINRSCNQPNPDLQRAVARDRFPLYSHYRGESHASGLVDAVLHGDPYPIQALIIHGASLLTSWPQTAVWRETLSKLNFLVSIDRQLTADAAYADIVLPATTLFEIDSYMVYGPIFRLREKLIEPVGEARNDYLIMAELAKHLGYGHLYPQSEEELIRFALQGSGFSLEDIQNNGGQVKRPTPMMEYRKYEKGGLRKDGQPGFETPSGKFEFYSSKLEEYGYEPLPKYIEPLEGPLATPELSQQFPLVFNSGARPQTDFRSQHHGVAGLNKDHPEPEVEINSEDARSRGIESGDLVELRTPRGGVPFRARVSVDIVRGAIEANMGGGGPTGPQAWREWNVNELTDLYNYDEISGFPVYKALLCEVVKLKAGNAKQKSRLSYSSGFCKANRVSTDANRKTCSQRIYLDNNATTALAEPVKAAMTPYLETFYGNPSSIHGAGRAAREAVDKARRQLARLINVRPRRIIFTGGGTEANNLALKGVASVRRSSGRHIITSRIEHPAILQTVAFLETQGFSISYLDVDKHGLLDPQQLAEALRDETILVSIMLANNEVGVIQPIQELAQTAHSRGALFHTDAVQAAGKIPVDVDKLDVDLLSLSAHKFHGPKGVGALYVRQGLELEPLLHGGQQEYSQRAGTENVPGIVGMGRAAELALETLPQMNALSQLRDRLQLGIQSLLPESRLNGHADNRLPNTLNMTLPGLRGESVVIAMDQQGIAFSSGSACKSGSPAPTHVLTAMGATENEAHCAVRFSLDVSNTEKEIETTLIALKNVLQELETTVRFLPCK